jgi:hypothetical protein
MSVEQCDESQQGETEESRRSPCSGATVSTTNLGIELGTVRSEDSCGYTVAGIPEDEGTVFLRNVDNDMLYCDPSSA